YGGRPPWQQQVKHGLRASPARAKQRWDASATLASLTSQGCWYRLDSARHQAWAGTRTFMFALGQTRPWPRADAMSALPPVAANGPSRDSNITATPLPHEAVSGQRNCYPVHNLHANKNDRLELMVQIKQRGLDHARHIRHS